MRYNWLTRIEPDELLMRLRQYEKDNGLAPYETIVKKLPPPEWGGWIGNHIGLRITGDRLGTFATWFSAVLYQKEQGKLTERDRKLIDFICKTYKRSRMTPFGV